MPANPAGALVQDALVCRALKNIMENSTTQLEHYFYCRKDEMDKQSGLINILTIILWSGCLGMCLYHCIKYNDICMLFVAFALVVLAGLLSIDYFFKKQFIIDSKKQL